MRKAVIILLLISFIITTEATPVQAKSPSTLTTGRQIVFFVDDSKIQLTNVTISGYNQNGVWSSWYKSDPAGFSLAYTKGWWWIDDFLRIDMTYLDLYTYQSRSDSCLIDVLSQPYGNSRVEILYVPGYGCVGGEQGSILNPVQDPIDALYVKMKSAFDTVAYYTGDFNEEVFMDTFFDVLSKEFKAMTCAAGIGAAIQTGGWYYAAAAATINRNCYSTAESMMKLFFPAR
jgi:hypothetical protein